MSFRCEIAQIIRGAPAGQRAFPADDHKRLQGTAIAGWVEMFLHDADSRVRLKAGANLLECADAGLKLNLGPSAKERAFDEITQYIAARKHEGAMGDRAVEVLQQAVQAAPSDATRHELGLAYIDQHSRQQAVAAFQKGRRSGSKHGGAIYSLGAVALESGDLSQAEPAFREAIRRQPDYAEAHSNLANVLSAMGRFEEARYHFEAALKLKPSYGAARYNYALALARADCFGEAQRQIEAELKSDPNRAEAHDLLSNVLAAQGKIKLSVQEYREALRIRPDFGRANLDTGSLLAESGDVVGALPYLRKAAASEALTVSAEAGQILQQLGGRR